jgi:hypothetical protein
MSLDLANEMWNELKRYIGSVDRSEAADVLVNLLVDHDYDADEIRMAFKGDPDIKAALQIYSESENDDSDDDYDDIDDEDY